MKTENWEQARKQARHAKQARAEAWTQAGLRKPATARENRAEMANAIRATLRPMESHNV